MLRLKLIQQKFPFYFVLAIFFVLAIRLFWSRLPSFEIDMGTWLAWSFRLKDLGFAKFYSDSVGKIFPPQNPFLAGAPLVYPYLIDLLSEFFEKNYCLVKRTESYKIFSVRGCK